MELHTNLLEVKMNSNKNINPDLSYLKLRFSSEGRLRIYEP